MMRFVVLVLVLVLSSFIAQGDPIVVGGGGASSPGIASNFIFVFGNSDGSVEIRVNGLDTVNPVNSHPQPGHPFVLDFHGSGLDIAGTITANGRTYPAIGDIHMTAVPVPFPSSFIPGTFHIFSTFTFRGLVIGYEFPNFQTELIRYDLIANGDGIVDATVLSNGSATSPGYTITHVTYTLPSPTPEPTTILLLVTGVAGATVRLRKRRL